jgi:hypothetical protein
MKNPVSECGGLCRVKLFSKVATNIRIAFVEIGVAVLSGSLSRAAVCLAVLALSGCKVFVKEEPPPCPRVSVVEDASKLVQFRAGSVDAKDIEMSAEIVKYRGSCHYDKDDKVMEVSLDVSIDAYAGPAFVAGPQKIAYFIAVPAFFPEEAGKKIFPVALDIPTGPKGVHITDKDVRLKIPVKDIKKLEAYEIFVGFQLDQSELDYNRKHDFR